MKRNESQLHGHGATHPGGLQRWTCRRKWRLVLAYSCIRDYQSGLQL